MGFAPGDMKASWVAIFVLFLLWWFTYLPKMFAKRFKTDEDGDVRLSRLQRTNELARDGTLLLTIAVLISFAGYSSQGATNALSWIFTAIWVVLLALSYFRAREPRILISVMEFVSIAVLVALIITAFASADGRYGNVRTLVAILQMTFFPFSFMAASRQILTKNTRTYFINASQPNVKKENSWRRPLLKAFAGACLLTGSTAFVLLATTPALSLLYSTSELLNLDDKFKKHVQSKLLSTLGWRVHFDGPIKPAWRDGRLVLHDVIIQYGEIEDDTKTVNSSTTSAAQNYTRFRFQVDRVEVKVSLLRFLSGRGFLEEAAVDGARGLLDKRFVQWVEGWRWRSRHNDLDMNCLSLRNVHFHVLQPASTNYSVTILHAELPRLRLRWLFYDMMNAASAQGIFDGHALFTLKASNHPSTKLFQMTGLDVKHLSYNAAQTSPLNWITKGFVDIEARVLIPLEAEDQIEEAEALERALVAKLFAFDEDEINPSDANDESVTVQANFTFRNLKARQPTPLEVESLLGSSSSRLKSALLTAVLGYLNEHRPEIPLTCSLQLERADFVGVWSGWECGLFGGLERGLDEAFRALVWDPEMRMKRLGRVGKYALQAFFLNRPFISETV